MNKKTLSLFLLAFVTSSTIVFATEESSFATKPSGWSADGTYIEYLPEGGVIIHPPGEVPSPTPTIIESPVPVIQCIKEDPPLKIIPVFDDKGELIGKELEPETDPEVWKQLEYNPNKCDTNSELYITEYMNIIDEKVYKTTQIQFRNAPTPTPTPKIKLNSITSKKINGVLMASARNTLKTFGFKVEWDKKKKILKATKGKQTLEFYQNSRLVKADGKTIKRMSTFSKIQNGSLMIPLNFITTEFKNSIIK